MDTNLAENFDYALTLAIYIDRAERIALSIDVHSGYGWANIKPYHLSPFIRSTVRLLRELHPIRLDRCTITEGTHEAVSGERKDASHIGPDQKEYQGAKRIKRTFCTGVRVSIRLSLSMMP